MCFFLDGSWLARGIGETGLKRFSVELTSAMCAHLAAAGERERVRLFSVQRPVEGAFSISGVAETVVGWNYRLFLYSVAVRSSPSLIDLLDPPPAAVHFHDAVRFAPSRMRAPRILVTVHDLASIRLPYTYSHRARWLRLRSLDRLRGSEALIHTYSRTTRTDLLELTGIPEERIHVVPLGVSSRLYAPVEPTSARATL
jgi:glycosyltransferase involved in cell wall biosynthesis